MCESIQAQFGAVFGECCREGFAPEDFASVQCDSVHSGWLRNAALEEECLLRVCRSLRAVVDSEDSAGPVHGNGSLAVYEAPLLPQRYKDLALATVGSPPLYQRL